MTQNLKLAFKNTLWFLAPSGITFLIIIALNVYWGFSGVAAWSVFRDSYYFLLLPNIPFFIASLVLFTFLRKGSSRIVSVPVSNSVAIGSYFLIFYLSHFVIRLGDIGFGGFLLLAIAILALIIFFIRSITTTYEFIADVGNAEIIRSPSGAPRLLTNGLIIILIIVAAIVTFYFFI